jgi:hypothetical protein
MKSSSLWRLPVAAERVVEVRRNSFHRAALENLSHVNLSMTFSWVFKHAAETTQFGC